MIVLTSNLCYHCVINNVYECDLNYDILTDQIKGLNIFCQQNYSELSLSHLFIAFIRLFLSLTCSQAAKRLTSTCPC